MLGSPNLVWRRSAKAVSFALEGSNPSPSAMENHFKPTAVAQKAVLFNHQGRILVLKQSGTNKYGHSFWDLPGGRVNEGENFEAAIRREIEEETGIRPRCVRHYKTEPGVFPTGDPNVLIAYTAFAMVDPKLSDEHSQFEWVDPKNLEEKDWMFKQMPEWIANAPRPQTRGAMGIVEHDGELLLLKRSKAVTGWNGWYYGVAGGVEDGDEPMDAILKEVKEETGIPEEDVEFVKTGEPFKLTEYHTVHPFHLKSKRKDVNINWEHDEAVWAKPQDVVNYNCVPFFTRAAKNLGFDVEIKADVVSCAVFNNGKMLLLKRGPNVATHRGSWGIVAGFVEPGDTPEQTALKEIGEEIGLQPWQFKMVKAGEPRSRTSEGVTWRMHSFMFETDTDEIKLDWEHDEHKWVHPEEVENFDTTPGLEKVLDTLDIVKITQEA